VRAGELVRAGAIGQVVQTIGMGPHRANLPARPAWFFQRERYGGILTDIAAHQMDQFLFFSGADSAEVISAHVANYKHPEHPGLEDYGEALLRSASVTGYVRVDWYTPAGLDVWGDARLFVLGTEGYLEVRKYIDLLGRPGGNHLFWTDAAGTHYEDCTGGVLPYGRQLVQDILDRTETAMSQAHCFMAMELALAAESKAVRLGNLC
jgi:predicted dehydrogenase